MLRKIFREPFGWFFIIYIIYGFISLGQYGIPLDELTQRYIGIVNNKFISGTANAELLESQGYFGPAFESLSWLLEQLIYKAPMWVKLYFRHAELFILFLLSVRTLFTILRKHFTGYRVAMAIILMYACYPLVFAHAHYNSKDTLFLELIIFIFYFLLKYFERNKVKHLVTSAILLGIASSIRMSGILVLFSALVTIYTQFQGKSSLKKIFIYTGFFAISYFVFFPYLWLHPIQSFKNLLLYSSNNPWPWNSMLLGQEIVPGKLPWWYLFAWIGITLPLPVIIFFIIGLFRRYHKTEFRNPVFIFTYSLIISVFLFFIIIRPTLYDSWRHMQFLVLPLLIIAAYGLQQFAYYWRSAISFLSVIYTVFIFIWWEPNGYVYMNELYQLFGKPGSCEQDYWGLSARSALKRLVHENHHKIRVWSNSDAVAINLEFFRQSDKNRIELCEKKDSADFVVWMNRQKAKSPDYQRVIWSLCPMKDTLVWIISN